MKANEIKPGVLYHAYDEELLEQRKKSTGGLEADETGRGAAGIERAAWELA